MKNRIKELIRHATFVGILTFLLGWVYLGFKYDVWFWHDNFGETVRVNYPSVEIWWRGGVDLSLGLFLMCVIVGIIWSFSTNVNQSDSE